MCCQCHYLQEIYNTAIWGPESYYDELAKIQKAEMDKREKEKKERTKVCHDINQCQILCYC